MAVKKIEESSLVLLKNEQTQRLIQKSETFKRWQGYMPIIKHYAIKGYKGRTNYGKR